MWTAHPAGRKDGSDPMKIVAGVDIGGTKCAVLVGRENNGTLEILEKERFATGLQMPPDEVMGKVTAILDRYAGYHPEGIGISCGGPLDSRAGTVECPPNLPLWDHVPVCDMLASRYHIPAKLQNDANACALAEWKFGAGQGAENVIFLTFGTGLGAGLILNGRLMRDPAIWRASAAICGCVNTAPPAMAKRDPLRASAAARESPSWVIPWGWRPSSEGSGLPILIQPIPAT